MLKTLLVVSVLTLISTNLASAGGNPSPGSVSEAGTILGTVSVATANNAIAAVGFGGEITLTGRTATVRRSQAGDITVTSEDGSTFRVSAGFVARLILAYFT